MDCRYLGCLLSHPEPRPAEIAIAKALGTRKALSGVSVRTSETHASLTGVPIGELRHLGTLLSTLALPD